jgi:hypothetical protein
MKCKNLAKSVKELKERRRLLIDSLKIDEARSFANYWK